MPKINVYLPDDLAAAVREAGIPVSQICQTALSEAVTKIGQARRAIEAIRDPRFDPHGNPRIGGRLLQLMTPRLTASFEIARRRTGLCGPVTTTHLLLGMLDHRDNLAVRVLEVLEVDTEELRQLAASAPTDGEGDPGAPEELDPSFWTGLSRASRLVTASAFEAALDLGHNYLGCEHLLVGLVGVDEGAAATVLEQLGVDGPAVVRATRSAVAGASHMKQVQREQHGPSGSEPSLQDVLRRLEALELRIGPSRGSIA